MPFIYEFEWDRAKADANREKHGVDFKIATSVFRDPLAATVFDTDHSEDEERWVPLGVDADRQYVLVVHTVEQKEPGSAVVRIISARRPTRSEIAQYERNYV